MPKPPRLLGYVIVRLPKDHVVFNPGAQWAPAATHMAHSPILIVGGREDLERQVNQRDILFPARQHLFPNPWRWIIGLIDRVKRSHGAPPRDVQGQLDTPIQVGLEAIGSTHRYAAEKFAASLAVAQALCQTAEGTLHLTPARETALYHLTSAYLQTMLAVADEAGAEIMDRLMDSGPLASLNVEERRRIDQVSETYLQHVREMLERKEIDHDEKRVKPVGVGAADPTR